MKTAGLALLGALLLPAFVFAMLPPPPDMDTWTARMFLVWLAFVGCFAGFGLAKA